MDKVVVTIARQYGSGGKTIGTMLAKEMGVPVYNREILKLASEDSGIHETLFGRVDEYTSAKPPIFAKSGIYTGETVPPESKDFTSDLNLFTYQAKIIKELADRESCVIIGRCSNFVLNIRDYPRVLRVFVHASWDFRMQEAAKKLSKSPKEIERFMKADDKRKMEYVRRFTGEDWTDPANYDLWLDTSIRGYDGCLAEIEKHYEKLKQEV